MRPCRRAMLAGNRKHALTCHVLIRYTSPSTSQAGGMDASATLGGDLLRQDPAHQTSGGRSTDEATRAWG